MLLPISINSNNKNVVAPNLNFGANLSSSKLRYAKKDFFINIKGYGKDSNWAEMIRNTADTAVVLIRRKVGFDNLLRFITAGVIKANSELRDLNKRDHTGILRTQRPDFRHGSDWDGKDLVTYYDKDKRYNAYADKFSSVIKKPLKNPYPEEIVLTIPENTPKGDCLFHADPNKINNGLNILELKYYELLGKYSPKEVSAKNLKDIFNRVAEIRWLMAHITPWERGSDAISNILMRALLKSFGIKAGSSVKGLSFDLEAYCTELNKYKQKFPNYFEKGLRVIE